LLIAYSINKIEIDITNHNNEFIFENFDNSFEKLTILKDDNDDDIFKNSETLNKSYRPITNKQKLLVEDIKNNVDAFIKDYNQYFFENFFNRIFEKIQNVLREKNEKNECINSAYNQQIKEMEILLEQGKIFFNTL